MDSIRQDLLPENQTDTLPVFLSQQNLNKTKIYVLQRSSLLSSAKLAFKEQPFFKILLSLLSVGYIYSFFNNWCKFRFQRERENGLTELVEITAGDFNWIDWITKCEGMYWVVGGHSFLNVQSSFNGLSPLSHNKGDALFNSKILGTIYILNINLMTFC